MSNCNEVLPKDVPGVLILTHGRVGVELIKSAEMIVGPMERVNALSLMPEMTPEKFMIDVEQVLESMPPGSLVISDLFGGTPANVSAVLSQNKDIAAVSGLSLGMLIEAVSLRSELAGERLAEAVIAAGKNGCQNILVALREVG